MGLNLLSRTQVGRDEAELEEAVEILTSPLHGSN